VKPPPFLYLRPETEDGVLAALAEHGDEAKVLAGGQSLVPLLNFRLARPAVLIDLERVGSLRGIDPSGGVVAVGAMTRQVDAERSGDLRAACPVVGQALGWVGHLQIRNRGTVGGSIAHADPAAELPAVALALDAEMVVRRATGERTIPASAFFAGPFTTALEPEELLTLVRFPATPGARTVFLEFARRSGDFALAGVCAVDRGSRDAPRVALAAIGVGGSPVRLTAAEALLDGRPLTDEVVQEAGEAASAAVDPPSDLHADSAYRRELLGVLVRRALRQIA
jgi:aerobic carbon-monoxide dehydrogenase medium subunit